MNFISEMLAVGMIALMSKWTLDFLRVLAFKNYTPLLVLLGADFALVAFALYPALLKLFWKEPHPYRVLYASIGPLFAAFSSGDTNLTLPISMRHGKESLGIKRRINAVTFPLFSVFGKGGVALVSIVCFITILRSYSPLEISRSVLIWAGLHAFLLSFVLCEHSSGSAFLALTMLCTAYGSGFKESYLLLKNAAPLICSFAAGFDALTAIFGSYVVALETGHVERQELRRFI